MKNIRLFGTIWNREIDISGAMQGGRLTSAARPGPRFGSGPQHIGIGKSQANPSGRHTNVAAHRPAEVVDAMLKNHLRYSPVTRCGGSGER